MTIHEAIEARHSVRAYKDKPLSEDVVKVLEHEIDVVNREGCLHIQLVRNEPKAFLGPLSKYGRFRGVANYLVVAGQKADDLDERVGYFGEHLMLVAQMLGLNTCWVGLNYSKIPGTYVLGEGEKVACYIAIGYGKTQGSAHKIKTVEQVSSSAVKPLGSGGNSAEAAPTWFRKGVEAARLGGGLLLGLLGMFLEGAQFIACAPRTDQEPDQARQRQQKADHSSHYTPPSD